MVKQKKREKIRENAKSAANLEETGVHGEQKGFQRRVKKRKSKLC